MHFSLQLQTCFFRQMAERGWFYAPLAMGGILRKRRTTASDFNTAQNLQIVMAETSLLHTGYLDLLIIWIKRLDYTITSTTLISSSLLSNLVSVANKFAPEFWSTRSLQRLCQFAWCCKATSQTEMFYSFCEQGGRWTGWYQHIGWHKRGPAANWSEGEVTLVSFKSSTAECLKTDPAV